MADIRVTQASLDALKARLATPEGREALQKLVDLIAQTALEAMPPEMLASLKTKKGTATFRAAWPDIVDALLVPARGQADCAS